MPPDRILFEIGDLKFSAYVVWACAAFAAFWLLVTKLSAARWKRKLTSWAESGNLTLVSWREAWFWEGPGAWKRGRSEYVFRVVTRDEVGRDRSGWVRFGTYWGMPWKAPFRDVLWDGPAA